MPVRQSCSRGHSWETAAVAAACPVCGAVGFTSAAMGGAFAEVLTALLGSLGDGIVAVGLEGGLVFNEVAERILGTIPVGRPLEEWPRLLGVLPSTSADPAAADWPLARALRGHDSDQVEVSLRNDRLPQGALLSVSARPLRDQNGLPCGALMVFRDVTPRRRDEQQLRATRLLFEALLDHCPDAIFFKDIEGHYLRVNRAQARMFGLANPEEAVGRTPADFFPEDYSAQIQAVDREVRTSEQPIINREEYSHWPDGRHRWVNATRMPLHNETGQVIGTFGIVRDITERKRTMEALRDSEARSRLLFEHSPDAIFVEALDGTILDVNPAACRLHELTRAELLGRNVLELVPAGYKEEVADDFVRLAAGELRHVEGWSRTVTGRAIPVELNVSRLDMAGAPVLLVHVRDLTERRRIDEQLLKLSRAVEQTADAVFITDRQGGITYVNPAFEEMTGYTLAEALGQTPRLVKSGRHDRAFFAQLWRTILAGRTFRGVITNRRKGGDLFTADVTISPLAHPAAAGRSTALTKGQLDPRHDPGGDVSHFVATWKDITEAKRAEQELRRSRERYELAVQGSKDGLWDWDVSRGEVYFSPRWKSMLGYADQEIANRFEEWASRLHPEDHRRSLATLHAYMDGLLPDYELEHRLRHKDGSWRWILARGVAFRDPEGRPYRLAGSHTDITERKRAEEALRRAMEAAESASRAKSQFLANVSHEIRTPLNGILGMTELTLRLPLSDLQRDYLSLVRSSTHALLGIINDLLDFSRIEVGRLELDPREFALRDELACALRTLAPRACSKGLDLVYRVDDRVPDRLIGDWPRLRQVLINLVGNAIKFTEVGEVVVRLEVVGSESAEDKVTMLQGGRVTNPTDSSVTLPPCNIITLSFEVRDSGIGIPPDKQQAVFEPFVQADGSMARKYGGTGLGLSISARLIEKMGGKLRVESTPGQGSTFHFEVPLSLASGAEASSPQVDRRHLSVEQVDRRHLSEEQVDRRHLSEEQVDRRHLSPTLSVPLVSGRSALVVVGGTAERQLVTDLLVGWGARVQAVADAGAAIAELERARDAGSPYAVVILDVRVAGGPDGPTQRFGQAAGGAAFVVLYPPPVEADGAEALLPAAGVTTCTRPLRPEDLARALSESLGTRVALSPPRVPVPTTDWSRPLRLLVAEDNSVNQRVMLALLGNMGHQVELAVDGQEAIAAWQRSSFDAIFMDVQMPGMDGLEACKRLRAAEAGSGRHVPIIAVTAHARKEHQDLCLAAGMDAYLVKPIDVDTLVRTLAELAERQESTPGTPFGRALLASSSPNGGPEVVDRQAALNRVGGDARLLTELVNLYRKDGAPWLADARSALASRDAKRLRRVAHTIKGAVSMFGATAAVAAAERVEELARSLDFGAASLSLADLEKALARLDEALPTLIVGS